MCGKILSIKANFVILLAITLIKTLMKHLFLAILAAGMAFSAAADDKVVIPDSTGFKFTDVKVIKSTPVKDQNKSGTCWCYSTNSFFENPQIRNL